MRFFYTKDIALNSNTALKHVIFFTSNLGKMYMNVSRGTCEMNTLSHRTHFSTEMPCADPLQSSCDGKLRSKECLPLISLQSGRKTPSSDLLVALLQASS